MRYALNVTAINGWARHNGRGQVTLVLQTTGAGLVLKQGAGAGQMTLAASGRAYARKPGAGSAQQSMLASGSGTIIPAMRGKACMALSASGNGRIAMRGASIAAMRMAAQGKAADVALGAGAADLVLTGSYGIPHPIATPSTFSLSIRDRSLLAAADNRTFTVPLAPELLQRAEQRRVPVAPTNRSL
ncbi:MAG TPA: hypothetical protein VL051_09545 [Burkholderiaceae bacterium]|nr:hypothetical protein [Burkholderiaceae bacterium]